MCILIFQAHISSLFYLFIFFFKFILATGPGPFDTSVFTVKRLFCMNMIMMSLICLDKE